jgi:HlyD family secretion protein
MKLQLPKLPKLPRLPDFAKFTRRQWIIAGSSLVLCLLVAGFTFRSRSSSGRGTWKGGDSSTQPILATVTAGPFVQEVIERGEVQSSSNTEVRCQVPSRGTLGVAIIQIVPEGTYVQPGDALVKLDDSGLQSDLNQAQIASNSSRALVVEAEAEYEGAQLSLNEYLNGPFRQEEQTLQSDEFVAQEDARRSEAYLLYSKKLAARGYVTEVQLEADKFAVQKARKALDVVRTKLEVLRNFTKVKTQKVLAAAVQTSEARLRTRENSHNLDLEHVAQIKDYIAKCDIKAPCAGQVVYANDGPAATNGDPLIQEGKNVRERQVIVRLPDPKKMRVLARVNESRIDQVKKGMVAHISVDAFPDGTLNGVVNSVGEYPLPLVIPYSTVKEYAAEIEIRNPPEALRSGMTAKVAISIASLDHAVQVPVQSVLERDERFFCLVAGIEGEIEAREVTLGPANDSSVVIRKGLQPDEHIFLAPQNYERDAIFPPPEQVVPQVASVAEEKEA